MKQPKSIRLPLSTAERAALKEAGVRIADIATLSAEDLVRATSGALTLSRARELRGLARFQQLPNVGPSIAADFILLGLRDPADLAGKNGEALYRKMERLTGQPQDPCVLDTFHSAIWHVEHPRSKARGWWEWSESRLRRRAETSTN